MSFILDALKKSELERQRQAIPGLVESGVARRRPRLPPWAIALCILLGINLILLLFMLVRGWVTAPHTQSQGRGVAPGAAGSPANDAADTHFSPLDPSPVYAPEIPVTGAGVGNPSPEPVPGARQLPGGGTPGGRAIHRREPLLTAQDHKAEDHEADDNQVLPSINELNLTGEQALPELHLDVHVFATRSAERFVFINMRKYHEGATLQEGPSIERIRRDGVVLDYKGLRFLLPRQ